MIFDDMITERPERWCLVYGHTDTWGVQAGDGEPFGCWCLWCGSTTACSDDH